MANRVIRTIRSLRLSMVLMVALIPIIAAGNMVPQRGRAAPWEIADWTERYPLLSPIVSSTGFDHVYSSWWFLIVFGVFFVNLSLITWDLVWKTLRKSRGLHRFTQKISSYYRLGRFDPREESRASFEAALKRKKYRVTSTGAEIYARKGWVGIWGGTVLHVGFVVMLLGAVLSGLFKFNGYTEVAEGQTVKDVSKTYFQSSYGPMFSGHREGIDIRVEDIRIKQGRFTKKVASTVELLEDGRVVARKDIVMNQPLYYKGIKVFQSEHGGPSVMLGFRGGRISEPFAGHVHLLPTASGGVMEKVISIDGTPLQAKITYDSGDEHIGLEVYDGADLIYDGDVRAGETVNDGRYSITVVEIGKWSGISVVYDWAVPVVFAGFALAVAGIAVMGLFDPREIWARLEMDDDGSQVVNIYGWGRWRNMFIEEFGALIEGVEGWHS